MKLKGNTCPNCNKEEWNWIPDSLAQYCKCGFVRVKAGKDWEIGRSIQRWADDLDKIAINNKDKENSDKVVKDKDKFYGAAGMEK